MDCDGGKEILAEVKEIKADVKKIMVEEIPSMRIDITKLQVKAGLTGLLAGSIPVIGGILLKYMTK